MNKPDFFPFTCMGSICTVDESFEQNKKIYKNNRITQKHMLQKLKNVQG